MAVNRRTIAAEVRIHPVVQQPLHTSQHERKKKRPREHPLRDDGIRVGVVIPGAVDTPLWDAIPGGPDRARMLRPEDVARAVLLMTSLPPSATLEELTLMPAGGIL